MKRRLSIEETGQALEMLNNKVSLGQVARKFKVNKPAILKSVNLWNTGNRKLSDGTKYFMSRGKMVVLPKEDKKDG